MNNSCVVVLRHETKYCQNNMFNYVSCCIKIIFLVALSPVVSGIMRCGVIVNSR